MKSQNLKEVASLFFKLGCVAFGGPAAHVAMMEKEVVEKRKWMSRAHFLDLMGATNLIPGPNSTEMTMHCGHERAGRAGLFVAGACFIFPAVLMTGFLAYLYVEYGQLPNVEPFIFGIKPAVLAIILGAVIKLGKKAVKNYELAALGILALVLALGGMSEVLALLLVGFVGMLYFFIKNNNRKSLSAFFPIVFLQAASMFSFNETTLKVFLIFLKVGAILYGSGYVLFAYLDAELVAKELLTRPELIDAIAIGQFTPGPVLSTATFIGYQMNGIPGAIAASVGIFLPSFLFVMILNPWIPKMRKSKILSYFLDSVNVAAVAVMVAVLINMGKDSLVNWQAILICALAIFVNFQTKVSSMWIILGGAVLGYVLSFIG
jgi:chromate transporter